MGSAFESKLTKETENSLARAADRLGVLIKGRVHEEITQIGMGCPIEPGTLAQDVSCSSRDLPFATLNLSRFMKTAPDGAKSSPTCSACSNWRKSAMTHHRESSTAAAE